MAVDYLQEYLGIDPNDYSAMEQRIAGVSPVGQSILPQAPALPRASIMDESDFAAATAPLMDRVYGREQAAREKSESLSNELQALQEEMARTSEAEVEKRAALERKMQEIMQQRDMSITNAESLATRIQELQEEMAATSAGEVEKRAALQKELDSIEQNLQQRTEERDVSISEAEDLASQLQKLESDLGQTTEQRDLSRTRAEGLALELQGVQANLAEITNLRDIAVQDYQEALQQQDVIRQQASENEAMRLEEQRNQLLAEREGIITTLEQDFGVQRSELESVIGGLEGQVGDLTSKVGELESVKGTLESQINDLSSQMQALEVEKQDALAQQDVIRAEAAQSQQDALAQQGEQFSSERSALEQQIADLTAQVGQQPPADTPPPPPPGMNIPGGGGIDYGGGEGPPLNYMEFIESGRTPAEYNEYMRDYIARTMPDAFPDLSGLQNVTDETRQLVQDSLASGDPILAPDRIQDMIDNMSAATGEGGLPEGYSYTPGPGSQGMAYTTVMPRQGFRYAYGPDGDRIEVPDNRATPPIDKTPVITPPTKPPSIDRLVPPKAPSNDNDRFRRDRERAIISDLLPPKRDDQLFIDDRPRDPRLDRERGVPIGGNVPGGGGIDYGGPQQPIPLIPGSGSKVPAIKEPSPIAPPPQLGVIKPPQKPISIGGVGGGSYREFKGPDGQVLSVGVRPPSFSTNPDRKGLLVDNINSGIIGKNPVVSSGIGGIGARPDLPKPTTGGFKPFFGSKKPTKVPMKPPSIGGVGGISGRRSMRPMMRAGGGAISQAIADLQNRLR